MSKAIGFALLLIGLPIFSAHASIFDDEMDASESAEAVAHCAKTAVDLFKDPNGIEYLSKVTGKHTKVSEQVDTKRYVFQAALSDGFGPQILGNSLIVDLKVTQPPLGLADAPAHLEWTCTLQKK